MQERHAEAIRAAAAEFLAREANRTTLITVTRVELSENGRNATVLISVYPESGEEPALAFANRNRRELGRFLESKVKGMRIPHFEFAIDQGDKNRRRLDELSN